MDKYAINKSVNLVKFYLNRVDRARQPKRKVHYLTLALHEARKLVDHISALRSQVSDGLEE